MALKPEQLGTHATDSTPRVWPTLDLAEQRVNPKNAAVIYTLKGTNKFVVAPANLVVTPDMLVLEPAKSSKKGDNDVTVTPKA